MILRRSLIAGALALPVAAKAQGKYPDRPIKVIATGNIKADE